MNLEIEVSKAQEFVEAAKYLSEIASYNNSLTGGGHMPTLRVDWLQGSACQGYHETRKAIESLVQEQWEKLHLRVIQDAQKRLRQARFALEEELERK